MLKRKTVQFVQGALSPLPNWKSDVLADPPRQDWIEKILSPLGAACPIDRPEE
jgi:hypothetical protein